MPVAVIIDDYMPVGADGQPLCALNASKAQLGSGRWQLQESSAWHSSRSQVEMGKFKLREEAKERLWMNKALKRALSAKSGDTAGEVRHDAIAG